MPTFISSSSFSSHRGLFRPGAAAFHDDADLHSLAAGALERAADGGGVAIVAAEAHGDVALVDPLAIGRVDGRPRHARHEDFDPRVGGHGAGQAFDGAVGVAHGLGLDVTAHIPCR